MTNEQEILEIVRFIKDNAVTKKEFNTEVQQLRTEMVTKGDLFTVKTELKQGFDDHLTAFRSDILTSVDRFVKLHEKLDQELTALRGKYDRLEEMLNKVIKHLQLDVSKL